MKFNLKINIMEIIKGFALFISLLFVCINLNGQTGDSIPPILNSITISPATINNGDTITVTIDVEDDLSGIDRIQVDIVNPVGEQEHTAFASIESWTSLGNNLYSYDVKITDWAISGEWYVPSIFIHDNAGNMLYLSNNDSTLATFTVISSSPDTTAPVLNFVTISPNTVNNGDTITVTVNIEDDVSGIDRVQVDIVNPVGEQEHTAFAPIESWTSLGNNLYSYDVKITDWAISGEWYVPAIFIHDNAGNMLYLNDNDSTLASFTVISSTPDTTAPVLNFITILPDTVNNGDTITVTVNIEDDVSGIDRIQVDIVNPAGEQEHTAFAPIESWTSLGNNLYSYDVKINNWAISGEWYVPSIFIHDNAGNMLYLSNNDSTLATFIVNGVSSINEINNQNNIIVYPNPSSGIVNFNLDFNVKSLYIYDYTGKIVEIYNHIQTDYIDLTNKPKGLYIFKFLTAKNSVILKKVLID